MQIAETLLKSGITAGTAFMKALTNLVANEGLTRIIETGTNHGTGTTKAILDGIDQHGLSPVSFVSIEVNPYNCEVAKRNTKGKKLTILNGLSIPREDLPTKEQIDAEMATFDDEVVVDHFPHNRAELYYKETNYQVPDRQLDQALLLTAYYPNLVVLDSGGHVGSAEFDYLMSKVKGKFYLALDDTSHVKHAKTIKRIEEDPDRFSLVFSTEEKFGSRIYFVDLSPRGAGQSDSIPDGHADNSGHSNT